MPFINFVLYSPRSLYVKEISAARRRDIFVELKGSVHTLVYFEQTQMTLTIVWTIMHLPKPPRLLMGKYRSPRSSHTRVRIGRKSQISNYLKFEI